MCRVISGTQAGGKAQIENVLTLLKIRFKGSLKGIDIGCGGLCYAALAHPFIKFIYRDFRAGVFLIFTLKGQRQRGAGHASLLQQFLLNITPGIGMNHIVVHSKAPLYSIPRVIIAATHLPDNGHPPRGVQFWHTFGDLGKNGSVW